MEEKMKGGRRIDDHSFWAGARTKDAIFPKGVKLKNESSAEGAGDLSSYEDTSSKIKEQQESSIRKVKAHPTKPLHRN